MRLFTPNGIDLDPTVWHAVAYSTCVIERIGVVSLPLEIGRKIKLSTISKNTDAKLNLSLSVF